MNIYVEMDVWKIQHEQRQKLTTIQEINAVIQDTNFTEFDFHRDGKINSDEFLGCFRQKGIDVELNILNQIFHISGDISIVEFNKY